MRPRVKPALRRIIRDKHTLQYGAHPLRAVMLSGLTEAVRRWIEGLDGTRDLECVLSDAAAAGLDEIRARSLLDQLAAQGALHDAATSPAPIADLSLAERDRLRPELDALDLASTAPDGAIGLIARRRERRVRVYGAGRVGAQVAALLAASGVGTIRILDPATARPCDITPGGLTWAEVGLPREVGAAMVARRLTSGGHTPTARRSPAASTDTAPPAPFHTATPQPTATTPSQPTVDTATAQPIATTGTVPPQTIATTGTATAKPIATTGTTGTNPGKPIAIASPSSTRSSDNPRATANGPRAEGAPTAQPQRPQAGKGPRTTRATQGTRIPQTEEDESGPRPSVNAMAGGPYLGDQSDRPDLVILTPVAPLDGVLVNELTLLGIPHLLASAFEGHGTVGPLVIPGKTACLHCLDLTRRDRDPMWPIVTARLGGYPPGEIACDVTLAALVAAAVAGHALAYLDGRESAVTNGTMDVTPDWRWKRRSWTIHPQCRCMRNNPYSLRMVMSPNRD
ncbi:thiamine biosynthesis protein ThiF [Nonomuraea sp. NPDC003709]|uniref:thiamine biosynthesis protein ThiF n=1 Tax=Nonomuraea sp. NPDC003709 TaxID=3154450 RepID=UPI00339FE872